MSKHESMHHAGCPSRENKSKKYQGMINNIYKCSQGMLKIGRDITVKLRQVTSDRLTINDIYNFPLINDIYYCRN